MHDQLRWRLAVCDDDNGLSAKAVAVALVLDLWMNKSGSCYPGKGAIARRARLSRTSVIRAVGELEDAGYLTVDRSDGGRARDTTNRYQAVIPDRCLTDTGITTTRVPVSDRTGYRVHTDTGTGVSQTPELVSELVSKPVTETVNGHGPEKITKAEAEATAAFLRANGLHTTLKEIHA